MDLVTKEDLEVFRERLITDIKSLFKNERAEKKVAIPNRIRGKEIKTRFGICSSTLQNWRIAGKVHPTKILGTWYYDVEELERLFNKK